MNEKVEELQEQPSDRPTLREVSPKKLAKILEAHRKWVESEGKEGERAYLFEANLQGAALFAANLQGAALFAANLQEAYLDEANLQGAKLRGANLQGAALVEANLQGAKLRGANLQGAKLRGANLQGAALVGANLQGATLVGAKGLTASQVKKAKNWKLAFYSDDLLKELGLPPDHNERVKEKLAEMEKEKKATGAK